MTQAERDRLVALKKAKKKLITQKQAAEEIGVTERQVRRLLRKLRRKGDQAVIHELRGRASNRRLSAEVEQRAIPILSDPVYRGFGPTLASEYLHKLHQITVSKETLRHWMAKAGLWRAGHVRVVAVHQWRPRRSRCGELVQWDTSTHDWDRPEMPPTQIERAWRELNAVWIPAHSPQAKGRVERQFSTAQERLAVPAADPADAHRPLGKEHDLAAIPSHVEPRQVTNDYTVRYGGKVYQIDRRDVRTGMRKAWVRVEERLDGTITVQFQGRYVRVRRCEPHSG